MNQVVRVELKGSAVVDGSVIDPIEQFALLFGSDKVVVTLVANVGWCFGHAQLKSLVHRVKDVFIGFVGVTAKVGNLQTDFDQDGERGQHILNRMFEREVFHILAEIAGIEEASPLDAEHFRQIILVFPNVLRAEINSAFFCVRSNKGDEGLDINYISEESKSVVFEHFQVVFNSGLKLDVTEVSADLDKPERNLASIVKDQNLTCGVAKHHWGAPELALVWLDVVTQQLLIRFGVKAQDVPSIDSDQELLEKFRTDDFIGAKLMNIREIIFFLEIDKEGSLSRDEVQSFWLQDLGHHCRLKIRQIVFGVLAAKLIIPLDVNE